METHEITNSELEKFANSAYVEGVLVEMNDEVILENSEATDGIRITAPLEIDIEVFRSSESGAPPSSVELIPLDGTNRKVTFEIEGSLSDKGWEGLGKMAFALFEPQSLRT